MKLVDTHAHLDMENFDRDRDAVMERAHASGVGCIITVGYDLRSSVKAVRLANDYDCVYAVVGVHPHDAQSVTPELMQVIEELSFAPKVVAIGEIGLDYYRNLSPRDVQRDVFKRFLSLARKRQLPVVIHERNAEEDCMKILDDEWHEMKGGVMHCFSGPWDMAEKCLSMGFYLSFGGPVTFLNFRNKDVVKRVPLSRLLVETDCPYLAPEPFRGKRNEPAYVRLVAEKIAELRGINIEELAARTTANARGLFGLDIGNN
ncbi:MAG TPA: TatD family hydrolase [Firmicutes bacterium]|nr:TatD family hydrolase [Bacillota bacterium]